MKKIMTLLLCFVLLLSLCACGGESAQTPSNQQTPAADPQPEANENAAGNEEAAGNEDPAEDEEPARDPAEDMVELVKSYIDKPIEELYAVIGEPQSSDYAPSCLGDGEDGMLIYDGFIVYTYREGDNESVYTVMPE